MSKRILSSVLSMTMAIGFVGVSEVQGGFGAALKHSKRKPTPGQNEPLPEAVTDADYHENGQFPADKVALGKLLFFDKILSGNKNISCATCHHPMAGTGDGLSLPVGEGGLGLGITRMTGAEDERIHERVPRNAPPVFNLGAREFTTLFHDGRATVDPSHPKGFQNPADLDLPEGLENIVAVQAMFPVTSAAEMAGQPGENPVADATDIGDLAGPNGVWNQLAQRLRENENYVQWFVSVFPEVESAEDITFVHAANAIAAFEMATWRADQSPFDRYLRGDQDAMSGSAIKGMNLFYGKARCGKCHSGKFQTDHQFHSICMPQIGPGKGDGPSGHEDFGRQRVTGLAEDAFKFRTPSLRNVALTAPYGHSGAYNTLEGVVRHHLNPTKALNEYDPEQAVLPFDDTLNDIDTQVMSEPESVQRLANANALRAVNLSETEFRQLMDFLHALTDARQVDMRRDVPEAVPSGLPVFD